MGAISVASDDFQTIHRVLVADNIVERQWPVFFHPTSGDLSESEVYLIGFITMGARKVVLLLCSWRREGRRVVESWRLLGGAANALVTGHATRQGRSAFGKYFCSKY